MYRIDWSQIPKPLPSNLFDKYTHQSILPPLISLNIDETTWSECQSYALELAKKGFTDPLSILYTSFKHFYPDCPSIRSFSRWLSLYDKDTNNFKNYFKQYSIRSTNILSIGELISSVKKLRIDHNNINKKSYEDFKQVWLFFSISMRLPVNGYTFVTDTLILDDGVTHFSVRQKKPSASRVHCLFALTPSGKFSNQLIICKQAKGFKMNFTSSTFTRIVQTPTGDITHEHIEQWFEDFVSLSYGKDNR